MLASSGGNASKLRCGRPLSPERSSNDLDEVLVPEVDHLGFSAGLDSPDNALIWQAVLNTRLASFVRERMFRGPARKQSFREELEDEGSR
jgi:hypothetical protein